MIDLYAGFLHNMETYRVPYTPDDAPEREQLDFATLLLDAMTTPVSDESSLEKLNRLYPNWLDLLPEYEHDNPS